MNKEDLGFVISVLEECTVITESAGSHKSHEVLECYDCGGSVIGYWPKVKDIQHKEGCEVMKAINILKSSLCETEQTKT